MQLQVNLKHTQYDIHIEQGLIHHLQDYIRVTGQICVITDTNVAKYYLEGVLKQFPNAFAIVVEAGETSKSMKTYESIMHQLVEHKMTRKDVILALGGGVIGDLAGFVASTYVRGIPFIAIPTSTLAQIDSSIGGKVAINLGQYKNMVGSFYHPSLVLIDLDTTKTLTKRHYYNGLVEAIKMGCIYNPELFSLFEKDDIDTCLEEIVYLSLLGKKEIVEQDEKEQHLRKILNFGHTIGHGIESYYGLKDVYHGEAVMIGMCMMLEDTALLSRIKEIAKRCELKTSIPFDKDKVYEFMLSDKKTSHDAIMIVQVKELGHATLEEISLEEMKSYLEVKV